MRPTARAAHLIVHCHCTCNFFLSFGLAYLYFLEPRVMTYGRRSQFWGAQGGAAAGHAPEKAGQPNLGAHKGPAGTGAVCTHTAVVQMRSPPLRTGPILSQSPYIIGVVRARMSSNAAKEPPPRTQGVGACSCAAARPRDFLCYSKCL